MTETPDTLATDLLWGAREIARYLGRTERATYAMIYDGTLPVTHLGKRIVASKAKLRDLFEEARP